MSGFGKGHGKVMKIGFVGLGLMGNGMVRNLLHAGFPVIGYDLDGSKAEALAGRGFHRPACASPGVVGRQGEGGLGQRRYHLFLRGARGKNETVNTF